MHYIRVVPENTDMATLNVYRGVIALMLVDENKKRTLVIEILVERNAPQNPLEISTCDICFKRNYLLGVYSIYTIWWFSAKLRLRRVIHKPIKFKCKLYITLHR